MRSISLKEVEAGRVDFSDIRDPKAKPIPPTHPGEILRQDFLDPLDITPYRIAKSIGVPATRIAAILAGERSITADTALRLARFFDMSAAFWLGLQEQFDLDTARLALGKRLDSEVRPLGSDRP